MRIYKRNRSFVCVMFYKLKLTIEIKVLCVQENWRNCSEIFVKIRWKCICAKFRGIRCVTHIRWSLVA